jgi:serine/threonine-protein kinase
MPGLALRRPGRKFAGRVAEAPGTIGCWRLTHLLAEGRASRVYRATSLGESPQAAGGYVVKLLKAPYDRDRVARAGLAREGLIAREVQHAHLATVLADHSADSQPYLALPFYDGITLAEMLRRMRHAAIPNVLSPRHACWIARQLAEALLALHGAGWLHGDVRPAKAIISPEGHLTLLGLGWARRMDSEECRCQHVTDDAAPYAAPECSRSHACSTAGSDVYSLGAMLFEMLTGSPPFSGSDRQALRRAHASAAAPDLRRLNPLVTIELAALVRTMLAKTPLRRPTASELVKTLAEIEISELATGAR